MMTQQINWDKFLEQVLFNLVGRKPDPELVSSLLLTLKRNKITSIRRIAHFLAQTAHESGGYKYMEEIADGSDYEGRTDLGNTEAGDGTRFKGRGLIQLTGRYNYKRYSTASRVDFIAAPEKLAQYPYCVLVAGWFWSLKNINQNADRDETETITKKINGGLSGIEDRRYYYYRVSDYLETYTFLFE